MWTRVTRVKNRSHLASQHGQTVTTPSEVWSQQQLLPGQEETGHDLTLYCMPRCLPGRQMCVSTIFVVYALFFHPPVFGLRMRDVLLNSHALLYLYCALSAHSASLCLDRS